MMKLEFENELSKELEEYPVVEMEEESVVLLENAYVKQIPILLDGSIRVCKKDESGKEIILYKISPGESCILSINSCLKNKQCNATAYIEKRSKIIKVPSSIVLEWMEKYKSWRTFVFNLYYERFDELLNLVDAIAFKQLDVRLINKLKEHQEEEGDIIAITHQTLANETGTVREVISRLLKELEKNKFIELDRGKIKIIKPL